MYAQLYLRPDNSITDFSILRHASAVINSSSPSVNRGSNADKAQPGFVAAHKRGLLTRQYIYFSPVRVAVRQLLA